MLILLQELMYRTYVECEGKPPRRDQIPKPCDHFDLIAGTGTGGLIALMLGRLRLDLETCKAVYVRMTRRVFETDKTFAGIPYRSTLFKASKLEEAIRDCVREHTLHTSEGNDDPDASNRDSIASLPYSPGSVPQRSISRGSFSTSAASHPMSPSSQRGSVLINAMRWGKPDALLYDNRETRTKTYVVHHKLTGCETLICILVLSPLAIRAPPAKGQLYFCDHMIPAENLHLNLIAPSGKQDVQPRPRGLLSSLSKLASMCLLMKVPVPTTPRHRYWMKPL